MISVVIPAYNAEETIIECIRGVLNQTRVDLIREILVVNDGSTDHTAELVGTQIDSGLVRVISKENGGVSSARNLGIKSASALWVALLDSDDVWLPQKIELQVEAIGKHPEIHFIGANRNNENVRMGQKVEDNLYKLGLRNILLKNWPHTSTALIKKSVFDEVGFFDENMRYAEDGNLWNRIVVRYPLYYIAESLEIAGGYKMAYGEKGLSSNLKAMHLGNLENLKTLKKQSTIGAVEYVFWKLYFDAKYYKRIAITKMRAR